MCSHKKNSVVCNCIKRGHKGFIQTGSSGYPLAERLPGMAKKLRGQELPSYPFDILPGGPDFPHMHLPLKNLT